MKIYGSKRRNYSAEDEEVLKIEIGIITALPKEHAAVNKLLSNPETITAEIRNI